ncbi:hypothetical protein BJ742DRAFT_1576 [Cladochytrium replicatum]|nr:hypothetical protein BJ742DRAFT_1576 [Cladochytrium replicatum]
MTTEVAAVKRARAELNSIDDSSIISQPAFSERPALAQNVQSLLTQQPLRVRKAVTLGYRTKKIISDAPVLPSPAASARSSHIAWLSEPSRSVESVSEDQPSNGASIPIFFSPSTTLIDDGNHASDIQADRDSTRATLSSDPVMNGTNSTQQGVKRKISDFFSKQ